MTKIKPRATLQVNKPIGYVPQILDGFVIVRDTREQLPYEFKGIEIVDEKLEWGDYSIKGFEPKPPKNPSSIPLNSFERDWNGKIIPKPLFGISIERKGITDFYNSITTDRDRFKRMLSGLRDYVEFKGLVIEASESETLCPELNQCQMYPQSVYGTLISIELRYNVHVYYGDRTACELKVLSWLSYYYKIKTEGDINDTSKKRTPKGVL